MKTKNINLILILAAFLGLAGSSCTDYLNVIPDNIPTVDHAFVDRYQAKGFLYGCYSFMPDQSNPELNPAFFAGDEVWTHRELDINWYMNHRMWLIAVGDQGTEAPIADFWASTQNGFDLQGGTALFTGIRDCNIFLENVHKPRDLEDWEREYWVGEILALKAYYHFWLMRMYGPIPLIKENIPISELDIRLYREPIDTVVNYIVQLLDEAIELLPMEIESLAEDLGRFSKPIAYSLKAQVLTYAASPMFNGNAMYADMIDNRGLQLFPQEYQEKKWVRAAEALKEAIDVCHQARHELYYFEKSGLAGSLNDTTVLTMNHRGAVTERWNDEIVWGSTRSTTKMQSVCIHKFSAVHADILLKSPVMSPPLRIIEQYYTENGVPIDEDTGWQGINLYDIKLSDNQHGRYIKEGIETINLHLHREPRFYASISFDGAWFYGNGVVTDADLMVSGMRPATGIYNRPHTGYQVKKLYHRMTTAPLTSGSVTYYQYAFPIIRLADLYLMYAEALNESVGPNDEVYEYIDLVRKRSGLKGVVESWAQHSIYPDKPLNKEGMRNIVRRERLIELAFEGQRYWDLRRWLLLEKQMNIPIRRLNVEERIDADLYYQQILTPYQPTKFNQKDYLWPIRQSILMRNVNLIQNPGW